MGAAIGGDFTEIRFTHPTVGTGSFFPKANEGNTLDLGGIRTNDDANQIDGSGNLILQKNRVRGSFECLVANDANTRNDIDVACQLSESPELADWTISHISGVVYGFTGTPVGDIALDSNAATFTLKVAFTTAKKIIG